MSSECRYRGRVITAEDIFFIRRLVAEHPAASRRRLSEKLCEAWQWKQANGALRDMVCRGLLLMLHRAGQIELPPVRYTPPNPLVRREPPQPMPIDTAPLTGALGEIRPITLQQVRKTADEQPVGEHLKYLVWAGHPLGRRPVACMAWSSAPRHLGSRDRYIGWNADARKRNIRFVAYNTRFLILPWVTVPNLASHILGRVTSALPGDWERIYSHPVYFAETFIDPGRFRGTCYRAANWVLMGRTTGRGKASNSYIPNRSIKEVLGLALTRRFRELLSE
jgi:hypothetical protein